MKMGTKNFVFLLFIFFGMGCALTDKAATVFSVAKECLFSELCAAPEGGAVEVLVIKHEDEKKETMVEKGSSPVETQGSPGSLED